MKQKIIRVVKEKSNKTIIDGFIIRSRMYYKNIKIIHQKHFDYVFFFFLRSCDNKKQLRKKSQSQNLRKKYIQVTKGCKKNAR